MLFRSTYVSGGAETRWVDLTVPASLLRAGDNAVAVELHQADISNGDAIFDLSVVGRGSIEAVAPSSPAVTVTGTGISTAALSWTAATDYNTVIGYLVSRDGTPLAFTTDRTFSDAGLNSNTQYTYTVTAYDTSGNPSVPGTEIGRAHV